jgi:hypothetical protein
VRCGCTINVVQNRFDLPPAADCGFCDGGGVLLRTNPLHLATSAGVSIQGEQDERVDVTEPVPVAKPKDTKCIVTSFCPRCGEKLQCEECRGPLPKQCEYCLTNTPKPHRDFGEAVR